LTNDSITVEIEKSLEILGLPKLITKDDIKKRYRYLAKRHHPDRGGSTDKMEEISSAYRLLMHYIDHFRYGFDEAEISRQYPESSHSIRFKF